jgi:diguanylate cyclase (GGDEF)-like protein
LRGARAAPILPVAHTDVRDHTDEQPDGDRGRRFHVRVQQSRAAIFTFSGCLAVVARLVGGLEVSWSSLVAILVVADATAVLFWVYYRRGHDRVLGVPSDLLWMATDIALITWGIAASGGSRSPWFPWYVANAAAAAYVGGRHVTFAVIAANSAAYVGVVLLAEPWNPTAFGHVLTNIVMLYGASFFALLGIVRLREKRRTIADLKERETRRAGDLEDLAGALAERTHDLDRANERLRFEALTDPLTRLHNRRYFEERIWEDVALVRRLYNDAQRAASSAVESDLCFLMVDIDHFKDVNDRWGHETGDDVLAAFADLLRQTVRQSDSVIRWGGEEFLVVMRQSDWDTACMVTGRLGEAVRAKRFTPRSGVELGLTCSVGFCCFPFGSPDLFAWDEVIGIADAALLVAKRSGRATALGVRLVAGELSFEQQRRILRDLPGAVEEGLVRLIGARRETSERECDAS